MIKSAAWLVALTLSAAVVGVSGQALAENELTASICKQLVGGAPRANFDYLKTNHSAATQCQEHYSCKDLYSDPQDLAKCSSLYGKLSLTTPAKEDPKKSKNGGKGGNSHTQDDGPTDPNFGQPAQSIPIQGQPPRKARQTPKRIEHTSRRKYGIGVGFKGFEEKKGGANATPKKTAPKSSQPAKTIRWY